MVALCRKIVSHLDLRVFVSLDRDVKLLFMQRLVRMFAFGGSSLVQLLFLSELGNRDEKIGLFMSATLFGDVVLSLLTSMIADSVGRRHMLTLGALLMASSGVIFALCSNYWLLLAASIIGVISPR